MRMPRLVCYFDRIQTNIEKLVDGFQGARDRQVVLEFDRDTLVCQRLED